jgi:hypothetical protein
MDPLFNNKVRDEIIIESKKTIIPLIDNLSAIYGRKAVYTCSIPNTIDESDYFYCLEDQIPRSVQLDGYIDEQFEIESSTRIILDIYLDDDYGSLDDLKEEYQLLFNEIHLDGMKCLGGCGFCNSIDSPFCSLCRKYYKNINEEELKQLQTKMIDNIDISNQHRSDNIRNFFQNPLPDFEFKYYGDEKITITYRCTDII